MLYCKHCGSELTGARKFCVVCGKSQDKEIKGDKVKEQQPQMKKKSTNEGPCIRCGLDTEKKCFFCKEFVCREHYTRMQANTNNYADMREFITQGETKRINEGWRGLIVYACPKCLRLRVGKALTDEETATINTVDECSWFKLESQVI